MLAICSYFLFLCLLLIFAQNNIHWCLYHSIIKLCVLNKNKIFPLETLLRQYLLAKILRNTQIFTKAGKLSLFIVETRLIGFIFFSSL